MRAAPPQLALGGRDKVTLIAPPPIASFGLWVEQLLAESTGKEGKGLIPVPGEPLGPPNVYGDDRVFAQLRLASSPARELDSQLDALEAYEGCGAQHVIVTFFAPPTPELLASVAPAGPSG